MKNLYYTAGLATMHRIAGGGKKYETKLFYDAAGRKTIANPKIKRFLFSPKKTPDNERK